MPPRLDKVIERRYPRLSSKSSTKAPRVDLEDGNAGKETEELNQARTFVSTDCSEETCKNAMRCYIPVIT